MGIDNITMADMLTNSNRASLIQYAELSGIEFNKECKKKDLIDLIISDISNFPNKLLHLLPKEDIYKLHSMIHNLKHEMVIKDTFNAGDCITKIGLTGFKYDGKKFIEFISHDLAISLKKHIDIFIENINNYSAKYDEEQLLLGLLNMYGIVSHQELFDLFKQYKKQISENEFSQIIRGSYLIYSTSTKKYKELSYISPFMTDPSFYKQEIRKQKKISFAQFTEEEIMMAGKSEFPLPPLRQSLESLKIVLKRIKESEAEIEEYISSMWTGINIDEDYLELISIQYNKTPDFPFNNTTIYSAEFVNKLTTAINEVAKSLPRWKYKGHSVEEVLAMKEKMKRSTSPTRVRKRAVRYTSSPCDNNKKHPHSCKDN